MMQKKKKKYKNSAVGFIMIFKTFVFYTLYNYKEYNINFDVFIKFVIDDPCQNGEAKCSDTETCINGTCKCGTKICTGKPTGSFCNPDNEGICMCTKILPACQDRETCDPTAKNGTGTCKCGKSESCATNKRGKYCDPLAKEGNGICKCSEKVDACTGEGVDSCVDQECYCGDTKGPCPKERPNCMKGLCGKYFIFLIPTWNKLYRFIQ